jgi:uncharacterized protein YjbI with pentapeptide repeats
MGNKQHIEILYQGVPAWNAWRGKNESIRPDLSSAQLCELDLSYVDFNNVNLSRANLSNSNLNSAILKGANLFKSTFKNTLLKHADLSNSSCIDMLGMGIKDGTQFMISILPVIGQWAAMAQHADKLFKYSSSGKIETKSSFKLLEGVSSFVDKTLSYADFSNANLSNADLSEAFLAKANFTNADLKGTNLKNSNLSNAIFNGVNLSEADLRKSDISGADFRHSRLSYAKLRDSIVSSKTLLERKWQVVYAILNYSPYDNTNNFSEADLSEVELSEADLRGINLHNANLYGTNLSNTYLNGANLTNAYLGKSNLSGADLSNADLTETSIVGANLKTLTGICIKDWNINSETCLIKVKCEYIYQKYAEVDGKLQFTDRLPRNLNVTFKPGEFEALIRKTIDTIDLIFVEGIDWLAFSQSFQLLRTQYLDDEIAIQAIERKGNGAFVVRLETSASPERRGAIEDSAKELYERSIKQLEVQVMDYAKLIESEKIEKSTLIGIVKAMAENQGSKYDLRGAKFGGGFAAEGGYQEGGQLNDYSIQVSANMDEIAKLIQSLKTTTQTFPKEQQSDIDIEIEELQTDLADEQRRDPKRLGKRVRSLWLAACAIAVGVAGITDFSNNVLELSKKLNVPIPIELIQQNPHILSGG